MDEFYGWRIKRHCSRLGGRGAQAQQGVYLPQRVRPWLRRRLPDSRAFAIFTLGLFAAGPAFFWAFPIVLAGQLLVAAVFGELASRWPYAGSVYQWARHVQGTQWGWFAAWAYMWGLTIALSALSYGGAGFLLKLYNIEIPSRWFSTAVALLIITAGTLINMVGRSVLKVMVVASIIAEVIGSESIWGSSPEVSVVSSKLDPYLIFPMTSTCLYFPASLRGSALRTLPCPGSAAP